MKKMFLEISQNSQENTCARISFLIKLQALTTPFIIEHLWRLLLLFVNLNSCMFFTRSHGFSTLVSKTTFFLGRNLIRRDMRTFCMRVP